MKAFVADIKILLSTVQDFGHRVWERGLSKFALDTTIQSSERFLFYEYSITVTPINGKVSVTLKSPEALVVLFYQIEDPSFAPEIALKEVESSTSLLVDVIDAWEQNRFVLED